MYIPRLMCTQHPDSTIKVSTAEEVEEAAVAYLAYGCDEVMVDYEGKATPYSQPRDIAAKAISLGIPLGERYFITPRIPNPRLEDFERSMLALEASVLANSYSRKVADVDAVRWIILPMVEDFETLTLVYKALDLKTRDLVELGALQDSSAIELIPLLEDAKRQIRVKYFIKALFRSAAASGRVVENMRVFLGISDSAVRHGHIASALAVIHALQQIDVINREGEYKIWPIVGMGSPPFRGGLNNPRLAHVETLQYAGYRTATVQSAVRYDVSYAEFLRVRETLSRLHPPRGFEIKETWVEVASRMYRDLVVIYLPKIAEVASAIPSTRERVGWKQYGRTIEEGGVQVPRAIVYTATWYFVGVPPTLLDAQFIAWAYKTDELDAILRALPALLDEWKYDSSFYCRKRAKNVLGEDLTKKIDEALDIMGIKPEPDETYTALLNNAETQAHALALGRIRGFLG
ncbi:MAG: phosphoenolpyruvate carboxylase [Pyrobaculum sp. OCT_11]|jgi:Phosphoenolpyruvate carboxylase (EC 4.1.1.31)|nr:MAG: phosphoenolpyruvate carboxylase [Pyrobaculum sp. OCT_11]